MKLFRFGIFGMTLIASIFYFMPTISYSQEIGEFCWTDSESVTNACILRLQVSLHGNYVAFNGKETCAYNEESNVSGSGYIDGELLKIGLTYIGQNDLGAFLKGYRLEINLSDLNGISYDIEEGGIDPLFYIPCP